MQIFSKLVVATPITTICLLMRNFIVNFVRILGICKDFAGNRVNELGNIPRVESTSKCNITKKSLKKHSFGELKLSF